VSLVNPELDYHIESFAAGFQDSPEPQRLVKGATPDAKNCLFSGRQQGAGAVSCNLQKRTGARLLTVSSVVAANGFDGLYEFRKLGQTSGRIVGVTGGKAFYWDNVSAFVQIGATAPFVAGTKVSFYVQRDLLFIMDGVTWRAWDGVLANDLFTPGQIPPTAAPVLAAVAGPGITGTFEGFAVWYDSTHDHESSPSALSAQVALVNQQRQWTKPAGAPAANYNFWRIYCRRVDTNEVYYKLSATVAIGAANVTEQVTDAARNLATFGPLPLTNDVPITTFGTSVEFLGYRVSASIADDQLHVSKINDPQSQKASDLIGVGRGTGGELRSLFKFGTECLAQKAQRSWRLKGDRMPFLPVEVHSNYGNVGPSSAVEVKGKLFAWDEEIGPYWTDLSSWEPLATGVVADLIAAIPRSTLRNIDAAYLKSLDLVLWSVPGTTGRRRSLLAYHVGFGTWLPPITGLEYATLCTFVDTTGTTNLYIGDYWGRLFQYFTDNVEGVPSGSLVARVSASSASTVTCDNDVTINSDGSYTVGAAVAFYTTGDGLKGLPVLHLTADGAVQWRRIQSNTGSAITLDTTNDSPWGNNPVAWGPGARSGDLIIVGGIDWYWRAPIITFGDPFRAKIGRLFAVQARPGSASFRLRLTGLLEGLTTTSFRKYLPFASTSVWGGGSWGTMLWGGADARPVKTRVQRTFFGFSFELWNPFPNQPVEVISARLTADPLPRRWVGSGG
jgi:hypothetical protein